MIVLGKDHIGPLEFFLSQKRQNFGYFFFIFFLHFFFSGPSGLRGVLEHKSQRLQGVAVVHWSGIRVVLVWSLRRPTYSPKIASLFAKNVYQNFGRKSE